MSSRIKEERKSQTNAPLQESVDSLSQLIEKWRELVNIVLSPVEKSHAAENAKAEAVEKYRIEVRKLLELIAIERIPQQPRNFENIEDIQNELFEALKSKEGKKFENQVSEIVGKHAAYEKYLQASFAEVLDIIEKIFIKVIEEERVKNEQEIKSLNQLIKTQSKQLTATRVELDETNHSFEEITKTLEETVRTDKKKLDQLSKEITALNEVKKQLLDEVKEFENLQRIYAEEKKSSKENLESLETERKELSKTVEGLNREVYSQREQLNQLSLERDNLARTAVSLAEEKTLLEQRLLNTRSEIDQTAASPLFDLNISVGSEDYNRPIGRRVRIDRRRSLSAEMNRAQDGNLVAGGFNLDAPAGGANVVVNPATGQNAFIKQLSELVSREDRKSIPFFKGDGELFAADWLKEAERIARSNEWDDTQKIKFFADRLRGEAYEWHCDYLERHPDRIDYKDWKDELQERFTDEADKERLRTKLTNLKQRPDQRVKAYIARINQLYDTVHGKEPSNSNGILGRTAQEYLDEIKKYRSEAKRKILLAGLLPKVKEELWPRLPKDADYDQICECAVLAENVVVSKELTETHDSDKLNAVLNGIQDKEKQHTEEIAKLKRQIEDLKISQGAAINAIGHIPPFRGRGRGCGFLRGGARGRGNFRGGMQNFDRTPPAPFSINRTQQQSRVPYTRGFRTPYLNRSTRPVTQPTNSERYRRDANGRPICAQCGQVGHLAKGCRRAGNFQ